jgi:hypothetical protein
MAYDITQREPRCIVREMNIFPHYKLIVFKDSNKFVSCSANGIHVCHGHESNPYEFVNNDFHNAYRGKVDNFKMLGRISEIDEVKAKRIFKQSGYKGKKYPSFSLEGPAELDSALDSLKSFLEYQRWNYPEDKSWILIPVPSKKPKGDKFQVETKICSEDFKNIRNKVVLDFYMTKITKDIKEIMYYVEIPEFIYEFLMAYPNDETKPPSKLLESKTFSGLLEKLYSVCRDAVSLQELDDELNRAQKVIVVNFNSSQRDVKDPKNFGYAGKRTGIGFQFFVGYEIKSRGMFDRGSGIYVDKRFESGVNGKLIEIGHHQRNVAVEQPGRVIKWTQEREDFFRMIEENFKQLSDNLNNYLSDIDEDKMDLLIEQSFKNLLESGDKN